jgi:S-adenosylmethionine:tRNA ribosyltransferase-isomerase
MAGVRTEDFDYELPSGLIAQSPLEARDSCRLLVLDRGTGAVQHHVFTDITMFLRPGDLLVVNETRVLPARLLGVKAEGGGAVEVLLLKDRGGDTWECLVKPGRRVRTGTKVVFGDGLLTGLVAGDVDDTGVRIVQFRAQRGRFTDAIHTLGQVPLPPYITRPLEDPESYQTVFATDERSAAAPTAGLHFTQALLDRIVEDGVHIARVELDVGLDTFRPVSEEQVENHHIHTEHFRVPAYTADAVAECRERRGRVVAVGTTTVRALESAFDHEKDAVIATEGPTSLFIVPGYRFRTVDAMVTNFHVPRSTLMMMVSAFAGRHAIMEAYASAIEERYRFLSFGDAMLII